MQAAHDPVPEVPRASPAGAGTEAILVVEDDAGVRSLVLRMLGRVGYRVVCAAGGDQAIAMIVSPGSPFDLVLCDVIMPDLTGREVVARIQAASPCTRALFMSGHTTDSLIANGRLAEGSAFIHKPFTSAQLARKVREVLDV